MATPTLTQNTIFFFTCLLLFFTSLSHAARQSLRPKALVLPISKDPTTLQYTTLIKQRTPLVPVSLVLDLGGQILWVVCDVNYTSSTYAPVRCGSSLCSLANSDGCGDCNSPPSPGCNNNTCGVSPDNSVTRTATGGELATDIVSVNSTTGSNPGRSVFVNKFLFTCAPSFLLEGLASGVSGMAGLGRTNVSLPSQFASALSFHRKFAVCLSSNGVAFIGGDSYSFLPNVVYTSQDLTYTPLLLNPVSTASAYTAGEPSADYFVNLTSIKVNGKVVPINSTLLTIDAEGNGGTKLSTVNPYTALESSIYNAVVEAFITEAKVRNMTQVGSVDPFGACFSSESLSSTRLGFGVPQIDLVLHEEDVVWSVFGANSMVDVGNNVVCLGFVNGGESPRTSVVVGGYQLENNLVVFDLGESRVGFSSLLFGRQTTCANFNFTSVA